MANEIVLYQPNDQLSLEVKVENDTVWLNRNQMAMLFDRDVKTIGKHINNALHEELAPTVAKNATLQSGTQAVAKNATPYVQVLARPLGDYRRYVVPLWSFCQGLRQETLRHHEDGLEPGCCAE